MFSWVATATVTAILTLSSWALSSPVGSSPDDDFHNVSIWCGQGLRDGLCEEGPTSDTVTVSKTVWANAFCFAGNPNNSGLCEKSQEQISTDRVNSIQGIYPDGYYWVMSWFASDNIEFSIIVMRIINSGLAVFVLAFLVVLLPKYLRRIPILSVIVTLVPLGVFIIPSVNPSSWLLVAIPALFASAMGLFLAEKMRERLIFGATSLISLLLGFSARADAPAYLLLAFLVAAITSLSVNRENQWFKIFGLLASLSAVFFVIWRFVYPVFNNLRGINFGIGQVDQSIESFMYNLTRLPDLFVGAFGTWGLGWLDTPMPSGVWVVTLGIYFAIVFSGIRYFDLRQSIAAGFVTIALFVVPLQFLWANSLTVGQIIQPRYLLPMLLLLAGVAAYRRSHEDRTDFSRGELWLVGFGLIAANTLALHTNLRRYLTGLDGTQMSLNRGIEWWWVEPPSVSTLFWFSPNVLWLSGSLSFAIFLLALWKLKEELGFRNLRKTLDTKILSQAKKYPLKNRND
jgi:hypothetical protein